MKHVIMVSIDNLRFDCIGYQPNKKELIKYNLENILNTPTLDSIAEKSVCFTNAISTNTYTTSSHASIITGLYPPKHGLRAFHDILSDKVKTLAEIFKDQDYLTVLATDWLYAWKPYNLHRGFTYIFDRQDKELYKFLDSHKDDKVFLLIHYLDVHEPYMFAEQKISENYNDDYFDILNKLCKEYNIEYETKEKAYDVWRMFCNKVNRDEKILFPLFVEGVNKFDNGRFKEFITYLKNSKYFDDSLIIIFSDHGEGRCLEEDICYFSHSGALYDNVVRIPLVIYDKNLKHRIIDTQISTVDIFSTIIDLCFFNNIYIPYKIDGQSLISEINGNNHKDRLAYSEVWRYHSNDRILHQRSMRVGNKKYIIYSIPEIFQDPAILNISDNEEFIKKLYQCILGRNPDNDGLEHYLKNIYINNTSKKDTLNSFLESEEYKTKRFAMFDLNNDPEELSPIDPTKNVLYMIEYFTYFTYIKYILDLEKLAIRSIFSDGKEQVKENFSNEDELKIKERLNNLGYLS